MTGYLGLIGGTVFLIVVIAILLAMDKMEAENAKKEGNQKELDLTLVKVANSKRS